MSMFLHDMNFACFVSLLKNYNGPLWPNLICWPLFSTVNVNDSALEIKCYYCDFSTEEKDIQIENQIFFSSFWNEEEFSKNYKVSGKSVHHIYGYFSYILSSSLEFC